MRLIIVLLIFGVTGLQAQDIGEIFGGITYTQSSIKDESSNHLGTFKPTVVGLGLSYVMADNLALDANMFDGAADSSVVTPRLGTVTVKVKNGYTLGVRPFMAFNESWGGYIKLGRQYGTQTTVIRKPMDTTYAHTVYGLGVSYNLNSKWGVSAESVWSKKVSSENNSTSTVGMGIRYKF
jgi:opacity protein-like surface antigen